MLVVSKLRFQPLDSVVIPTTKSTRYPDSSADNRSIDGHNRSLIMANLIEQFPLGMKALATCSFDDIGLEFVVGWRDVVKS